jgi:hypothetical protein
LLTPRGLSEKAKKSYLYTLKTLQSFALIKTQIRMLLGTLVSPNTKALILVGEGDLADLIALELADFSRDRYTLTRCQSAPAFVAPATVLLYAAPNRDLKANGTGHSVDVLQALADNISLLKTRSIGLAS